MLSRIKSWFAPPHSDDDPETSQLSRRIFIIWTANVLASLIGLAALIVGQRYDRLPPFLPWLLLLPLTRMALARRRVRLAALLLSLTVWLVFITSAVETGGIRAVGYSVGTVLSTLVAGLLLGLPGVAGAIVANLLAGIGMVWGETHGWIVSSQQVVDPIHILAAHVVYAVLAAGLLFVATSSIQSALSRTHQEVVERRRTEHALRLSEERYRLLAGHLPDSAVLLFDHELRFALVDGPEVERSGFAKIAMEGKTLYEVLPADFARLVEPNVRAVLAGRHFTAEFPYGEQIYFYTYMPIINDSGEVIYGMILAQNVTARKRAETEREQLIAELEARNAELERFTYTVSHDLKSPLITIAGFLGYLERDAEAGEIDRLRADLNRIRVAADKMRHLLDDLLELSRIGRLVNPPEPVALSRVVHEALQRVDGRLSVGHVRVTVGDDLPIVYGDYVRLVEVLQNLLENAARFMGDQPAPHIVIGVRRQNDEQVCFVRDNGIGIDPRFHQKIFGLFEKLDPQGQGTGIGLALVKRIVEVHSGRIWVESQGHGHGSTFCFTLPPPP